MRPSTLTCVTALWVSVSVSACAGSQTAVNAAHLDVTVASLYPLQAGCAWSYDVDSGDGQPVLATAQVIEVTATTPKRAAVKTGQAVQLYELGETALQRVGQGYDLLHAPFTLGAHWRSSVDAEARVTAIDQTVKLGTETYAACVVIDEQHTSSAQRVTTTYCPGVGPVRIVSQMTVRGRQLRVLAALRGFGCEQP